MFHLSLPLFVPSSVSGLPREPRSKIIVPGGAWALSTPDLLQLLSTLAWAALAGRLLLACMPADGLDRRQLPVTWVTSLYLGWAGLTVEVDLARMMGLEARPWQLALPWIALGFCRLVTLPGAMSPRHPPRESTPTTLARSAAIGLSTWLVILASSAPLPAKAWDYGYPQVPPVLHVVAIAVFALHGLRVARRNSVYRTGLVFVLVHTSAIFALALDHERYGLTAALMVAGAAFSISWLRRANKRALVLALIAFGAIPATGSPTGLAIGIAGLASLSLATPGASRRRIAIRAGVALVIGIGYSLGPGQHFSGDVAGGPDMWVIAGWWILTPVAAFYILRAGADSAPRSIDRPRRELVFLLLVVVLASVGIAMAHGVDITRLASLTPIAALACGLALPSERA